MRYAELAGGGNDLALDHSPQHRVLRLVRDQLEPQFLGQCRAVTKLVGGPFTDADVEDLAPPYEITERLHRLFERRGVVVAMRLIEIDVIGLQPAQRAVDRLQDVLARQTDIVVSFRTRGTEDLRENLQRLAPLTLE